MVIARLRALTHYRGSLSAIVRGVEMVIARLRALTQYSSKIDFTSSSPVEMVIARLRALTL